MTQCRPATDPVAEDAVAALLSALRRSVFGALPEGEWTDGADLVSYAARPAPAAVQRRGRPRPGAPTRGRRGVARRAGLPRAAVRGAQQTSGRTVGGLARRGPRADGRRAGTTHVLLDPSGVVETTPGVGGDQLVIHVVDPTDEEQVGVSAQLLANGFEAPVELLAPLVAPELLTLAGVTAYLGRTAGEPCTTGLGVVGDGHVGVFNIATPPVHRNRGFGHAVTARVVADGVRAGAHRAYLQASPMGFGVYERMGFRTVETWTCFYPS